MEFYSWNTSVANSFSKYISITILERQRDVPYNIFTRNLIKPVHNNKFESVKSTEKDTGRADSLPFRE